MVRIISTIGADYPKFLVLGCDDFKIVDKAYSLPEATIKAETLKACFVLKILRTLEGASLEIFGIEEGAPVMPVSIALPPKPAAEAPPPREEAPLPEEVEAVVAVEEERPPTPPGRIPRPATRRRRPPIGIG